MSEFVFRNLSVKLFPDRAADAVAAADPVCVCCSYAFECADCSLCTDQTDAPCSPCTDTPTDPCGPCTGGVTDPPPQCGIDSCLEGSGCLDSVPIVVQGDEGRAGHRSPDVIAAELEELREELRRALRLPAREVQVRVEDELPADKRADLLRGVLLDAVAELDRGRSDG
ncbi:hypothetical protein ACVGOW_08820 [Pseudonocardia saturnea]